MADTLLFEARITDEGISALRGVLGLSPQQVFSPGVEVEDEFVSSPSYSIPMENRGWLIIENAWLETPKDYIDYYRLSVHSSPKPKDISVGSKEHIGEVLNFPLSSISIGPPSPIVKIGIYEAGWSDPEGEESVAYDRALIFHRADGGRFAISTHDSIADLLDFTKVEQRVQEFIDSCRCRVSIE